MILRYQKRGSLPIHARATRGSRIIRTANFFNGGIEMIVYEPPVRERSTPVQPAEIRAAIPAMFPQLLIPTIIF